MSVLKIVHWPDPVLLKKARAIRDSEFKSGLVDNVPLQTIIENLTDTMFATKGVGLAAPQVGLSLQICVLDPSLTNKSFPGLHVLINPLLKEQTGEFESDQEGCLSFPEIFATVRRKLNIVVSYRSIQGAQKELKWTGYPSRVALHEMDHLSGVVFINRIDAVTRAQIKDQLEILEDEYNFIQRTKK
jgi:peptide deformylase